MINYFVIDDGLIHEILGYIVGALVVSRLVWGFVGTQYARFKSFFVSPRTLRSYISAAMRNKARRYLSHNPAGAYMIFVLLMLLTVITSTGIMMETDRFWGEDWVEELHFLCSDVLMFMVFLHVIGVIVESVRHRENLVRAMIDGRKRRGD